MRQTRVIEAEKSVGAATSITVLPAQLIVWGLFYTQLMKFCKDLVEFA
ncbi:hypothetical protein HW132_00095 [Brasilonema sp. CT11]|nr:hypothetical protein [Brasilonema sp. CT11]